MNLPPTEQIIASAVRFLIDGGEQDAASVLLACSEMTFEELDVYPESTTLCATVRCPRVAHAVLKDDQHFITEAVKNAIDAVLPHGCRLTWLEAKAEFIPIDDNWRDELEAIARGKSVHNQAVEATKLWMNLRFRSQSEIRIAEAFDRAGVLFLPNCLSRLGPTSNRQNREADFIVCYEGKWGILEVDGPEYHQNAAQDHSRDRLFKMHGIRVAEHFSASDCYKNPDGVVKHFLEILKRS